MKFFVLQISFAMTLFSFSVWAADGKLTALISSPILIENTDVRTWPDSLTLPAAFDIFSSMMKPDSETLQILTQSRQKLAEHGIADIHSILSYCPDDGSLGDAYFAQEVKIAGTRITIPGISPNPWAADSLEIANKAFSSKIVKTPFIEFLLVAERPGICLKKSDSLLFSYNPIVHELLHFLRKDPFKETEDDINAAMPPDLLNSMVLQTGGELQAYEAGLSAEIRFMQRNHVNLQLSSHRFFDQTGHLIDASGFQDSVLKIYAPYYDSPANLTPYLQSRLSMIQWQIQILETTIRPLIFSGTIKENESKFSEELARLKSQQDLLIQNLPAGPKHAID